MNRLLGTLFALATLAAIAFAILNIGNYSSMCFVPDVSTADTQAVEQTITLDSEPLVEDDEPIECADSTAFEPIEADCLL